MPVSYPTTDEPYPESSPSLEYGMQTWTIETPDGVIEAQRGQHSWNYEGTLEALLAGKIAELAARRDVSAGCYAARTG